MNKETTIISSAKNVLKENLKGIFLFGSYIKGGYQEGESDIDSILITKRKATENQLQKIREGAKEVNLSIQCSLTIKEAREKIAKRKNWATWLLLVEGKSLIYKTQEIGRLMIYARKNQPTKKALIAHIKEKDWFEIGPKGYLQKRNRWEQTKGLANHIIRKLQIVVYLEKNKITSNPKEGITLLPKTVSPKEVRVILQAQQKRKALTKRELEKGYTLAQKITLALENASLK